MADVGTGSPACDLCRIADGRAEAHRLHETESTVAFLDVNPAVTGHPQVAPKPHVEDVVAADPGPSVTVFAATRTVASAIGAALDVDGHSLAHASGPLVGTVEHAHVHLLPRRDDDAVSMSLARCDLDDERGAAPAERIREAR